MATVNSLINAEWKRGEQPIISAMLTGQQWCRVTLYSPSVVRAQDKYRMWYAGNNSATRSSDMDLGYAESDDGLVWSECPDNPILSGSQLPEGKAWQTPHVMFDEEKRLYKMWFVMADMQRNPDRSIASFFQKLGYAVSEDGIHWDVHPAPLFPSGRRPCVLKGGPDRYRMWMNSASVADGDFNDLVSNIYRFDSTDGVNWTRASTPAVIPGGVTRSIVYPYVLEAEDGLIMWYGAHVEGGLFEIFCSTSSDGENWKHHHDKSVFPATRNPNHFDGRYTSTPCVLEEDDRLLLYYSTRDCGNLYRAGDGTLKHDGAGIYRHIGVAISTK